MIISWNKLKNCPKNREDSKVLLVGIVCSMIIFSFFTMIEEFPLSPIIQAYTHAR